MMRKKRARLRGFARSFCGADTISGRRELQGFIAHGRAVFVSSDYEINRQRMK